jgi:hypothetical protein
VAKKQKNPNSKDLNQLDTDVRNLIDDVGDDRARLTEFLDDLIQQYKGEQGGAVGIAEYVAKLAEALTRQNQVRVNVLKVAAKVPAEGDEDDTGIAGELGLPFTSTSSDDHDSGGN